MMFAVTAFLLSHIFFLLLSKTTYFCLRAFLNVFLSLDNSVHSPEIRGLTVSVAE